MKFKSFCAHSKLISFFCATLLIPQIAHSADDVGKTALKFKRAEISVVKCPRYIGKLSTGLYTSINPANTLCSNGTSSEKGAKILKAYKKLRLTLDGTLKGNAFEPVVGQEGDVNTDPFNEVNYPVAINFQMTNAEFDATYRLSILDAETGETVSEAERGHVPAAGWVTWIGSGRYFFKTMALPDKEANQPIFDVNMEFMDQYEGFPVLKSELKDAGIKTVPCPNLLVDVYGEKTYSTKGLFCSNSPFLEDAGLTAAPFNLTKGLFLTREVSPDNMGGVSQGFPFRVLKPTALEYSVDDPATYEGQKGSTAMYLFNISSGKRTKLVSVQGSIASTTTYINLPGDYVIEVETNPKNLEEFGDICWEIYTEGSD